MIAGNCGNGSYDISGGTLTAGGVVNVAKYGPYTGIGGLGVLVNSLGSTGTLSQEGGTANLLGSLNVGYGGTGTCTISNGSTCRRHPRSGRALDQVG